MLKFLLFNLFIIILTSGCTLKGIKTDFNKSKRTVSSMEFTDLIFFDTWIQAQEYYDSKYSKVFGKSLNKRQVSNREKYEKIDQLASEVIDAFYIAYPSLKTLIGPKKLHIIVYDSPEFDAKAVTSPGKEANYYIMLISKGALYKKTETKKTLIAHELAHIFFHRNSHDTDRIVPQKIFYDKNKVDFEFLFEDNLDVDLEIQKKMKKWKEYAFWWGGVADPIFSNIGAIHTLSYSNFLFAFYNEVFNSGCPNIKHELNKVLDLAYTYEDNGKIRIGSNLLVEEEKAVFKQLSIDLEKTIKTCMGNKKINISKVLMSKGAIETYGIFPGTKSFRTFRKKIIAKSSDQEFAKTVLDLLKTKTTAEIFFKITKMAYSKMKEVESEVKIQNI